MNGRQGSTTPRPSETGRAGPRVCAGSLGRMCGARAALPSWRTEVGHTTQHKVARADLLDASLVPDRVHDDDRVAVGNNAGLLASVEGRAGVVAVAARLLGVNLRNQPQAGVEGVETAALSRLERTSDGGWGEARTTVTQLLLWRAKQAQS